jgi:hypothetical protein
MTRANLSGFGVAMLGHLMGRQRSQDRAVRPEALAL